MDVLLTLVTPVGLVSLLILGGGVFILVIAALGGWGERTAGPYARIFLGVVGTIITIFGIISVFIVVYPVIHPNIVMIKDDLGIYSSEPIPTPQTIPIPNPYPYNSSNFFKSLKTMSTLLLLIILATLGVFVSISKFFQEEVNKDKK